MATTITQGEENPRKTLDQQHQPSESSTTRTEVMHDNNTSSTQPPPQPTIVADASCKDGDESKSIGYSLVTGASAVSTTANNDALASDVQKKFRRAERFGMPVQLSEKEKRNSRAERFGTGSTVHESDALKKSEEQKRKARAERFGLLQSESADEEAKKKARLARFAAASKTDSLEEDKKKARAIRFSVPPSSLSQVNGEGDVEPKTAIIGKAGGGA